MKVLLDENAPLYLKRELVEHDVSTAAENGWGGVRNGILLGLAETAGFDVVLTFDRNIQHQQNVSTLGIAIVVLAVRRRRRETILPLVPDIRAALAAEPQPGTLSIVGTWRVRDT